MPKRTKYRRTVKGCSRGYASRGTEFIFGEFALKITEAGRISSRQIEAACTALIRFVKRQGKTWIRVFPDKPLTKKPLKARMGKGKGTVEEWIMNIKPGCTIYEMTGVSEETAGGTSTLAMHKLLFKAKFVTGESQDKVY